jgi:transposase
MTKDKFTTEEKEKLQYWRYNYPEPKVQLKMETLYLKSQNVAREEIIRLCQISKATYYRYCQQYEEGGLEKLKESKVYKQQSELKNYQTTLEASFINERVATVAQACDRIEKLTGVKRGLTQVRKFLKSLGLKPRKVGQIPAKADLEEQERFKTQELEPRLEQAVEGKRAVFFVDAAHFVFAPFLGILWSLTRLFVKAPCGRQRLNVLAALNATTKEILSVKNSTYITAQTVCELLLILAAQHIAVPITLVLDNARYQRCSMVENLALSLNIELLFLPSYSPNLNLIERFWKFVKKKCLYSKYYPNHLDFQQAIIQSIDHSFSTDKALLDSLLTLKFQTFNPSHVIGHDSTLVLFPLLPQPKEKISSQAA